MFLVTVRTSFFSRCLAAADARDALQTLWMFAGQDFEIIVLDTCGREMSVRQLEALALPAGSDMGCGASSAPCRAGSPSSP